MGIFDVLSATAARFEKAYLSRPTESFSDIAIGFFALWTVTWNACYFFGGSFAFAASLWPASFGAAALLPLWRASSASSNDDELPDHRRRNLLFVALFSVIWAVLALVLNRPDADDEVYLGLMVSFLSDTSMPIKSIPDFQPGTFLARYAISSIEPLRAVISQTSGYPLLFVYFIVSTAVAASVAAIVNARLIRLSSNHGWVIAMIFLTATMLIWGEAHRTYANFGLVRLFQGKGMLVTLFVPALFLYFLKLVEGKHVHYDLAMTVFALLGAVGANPIGLGVGALLLVLLAASAMRKGDFRKYGIAIFLVATVVVPLGLFMFFQYGSNPRNLVHTGQGMVAETTNTEMYQLVFGESPRGAAMLLLGLVSFYFVKPGRIQICYKRFVLIFLALLLFPWTSMILAKMTYPTFAWRWLWIVPIPLLASISIAGIYGMIDSRFNRVYALAALGIWLLAFIYLDPRVVVSQSNNAQISWPGYKVDTARAREEGRPDNQVYLRNRQEWATIAAGWLHIPSTDRRF